MNNSIQFWRWLFTCLVCMLHFEFQYLGGEQPIFKCCYLAVEFFFILSGFFMMKHAENHDDSALMYSAGRVKRFYPGLFLSWVLLILNIAFVNDYKLTEIFDEIKKHIWEYLLMNSLGISWDILNGATWYISALVISGYFIYWLIKKNKKVFIQFIAPMLIFFIYSYYAYQGSGLDYHLEWERISVSSISRAVGGLCIGCITYEISTTHKALLVKFNMLFYSVVELFALIILAGVLLYGEKNSNNLLVLFAFPILIAIEYNGNSYLSKIVNSKVSGFLGDLSLTMYLNQVLIIGMFVRLNNRTSYLYDSIKFLVIVNVFGIVVYCIKNALKLSKSEI